MTIGSIPHTSDAKSTKPRLVVACGIARLNSSLPLVLLRLKIRTIALATSPAYINEWIDLPPLAKNIGCLANKRLNTKDSLSS